MCKRDSANIWISVDVLGSAAFTPVKNDLLGNIKVRFLPTSLMLL